LLGIEKRNLTIRQGGIISLTRTKIIFFLKKPELVEKTLFLNRIKPF